MTYEEWKTIDARLASYGPPLPGRSPPRLGGAHAAEQTAVDRSAWSFSVAFMRNDSLPTAGDCDPS
jgi:hypothetical protein